MYNVHGSSSHGIFQGLSGPLEVSGGECAGAGESLGPPDCF
jgi:hypothetical protein